jgi:hypothetical protein
MGLPALSFSPWWGLFAPKGTQTQIIDRLNAAAVDALADPAARSRLADLGVEIFPTRTANADGAQRVAEGPNREMVADHQGTWNQGGVNPETSLAEARGCSHNSLLSS